MRALISVSNKSGIVELAEKLSKLGVEIISTGGTLSTLHEAGIKALSVSDVTKFPECLDGRVKTLHPSIHGGILAVRENSDHMNTLKELDINTIDIVIVNLYPFKETVSRDDATLEDAIENIDIGGPSMIRAAAKNYKYVTVVVDPADYDLLISELERGKVSEKTNLHMAVKAFNYTASYDGVISIYLRRTVHVENQLNNIDNDIEIMFPKKLTLSFDKVMDMRYGENPHQTAAYYGDPLIKKGSIVRAEKLHGKELSYNNINDANGALQLLKEFDQPTVVAIKHANPCGVGSADNIYDAYMKAYNADKMSIYGGIIAANMEIDSETAKEINKIFVEIMVAPSYSEEALRILTTKKNIRILTLPDIKAPIGKNTFVYRSVHGGILVQTSDSMLLDKDEIRYVTDRKPTQRELEDLFFTFKIVKHVKSNGIAIGKDFQSVGIGPGQSNRIWACKQAIEHGRDHLGDEALKGAVMASDAYFPFPDSVIEASAAGITAIIQPGGSKNDDSAINYCNENNIAMIFTGYRHFKH